MPIKNPKAEGSGIIKAFFLAAVPAMGIHFLLFTKLGNSIELSLTFSVLLFFSILTARAGFRTEAERNSLFFRNRLLMIRFFLGLLVIAGVTALVLSFMDTGNFRTGLTSALAGMVLLLAGRAEGLAQGGQFTANQSKGDDSQ